MEENQIEMRLIHINESSHSTLNIVYEAQIYILILLSIVMQLAQAKSRIEKHSFILLFNYI